MKNILALAGALALMGGVAHAAPIAWDGNGHSYELILTEGPIDWTDASAEAEADGGYLATITSQEEWDFVDAYVNPTDVKAWLGGTDEELEGNWQWVTGEDWVFDNWSDGETGDDGWWHGENYLAGWWFGDYWNDTPESGWTRVSAYVVEYDMSEIPLPASLPLLAGGLGLLGLVRRKKKSS